MYVCIPVYTNTGISVCMHVQNTSEIWELNCHSQISQEVFLFLFLLCLIHVLLPVSQSTAIPGSLGSVRAKSCQDQGGRIALGMPQELVCFPFPLPSPN